MKRFNPFFLIVAFFIVGCGGDEFTDTPYPDPDAGTGGDAATGGTGGNTGGSAGSGNAGVGGNAGTGGDAGSAGTGGKAGTGGDAGTGGNAGTGGDAGSAGTGGSNPCPDATYDGIATALGESCGNLFPSGCGTANPVSRAEFITVVISQVPEKLQGYTAPATPSFSDVPTTHAAEKALWLALIQTTVAFHPSSPTVICWAEEVITTMQALPDIYAVVGTYAASQTISVGPVEAMQYAVYGTSSTNRLNQSVRVVNNKGNPPDFSIPQPTGAFAEIRISCEAPSGGAPYKEYSETLDLTGQALFPAGTLDCFSQSGGLNVLRLAIMPGVAGQEGKVGLDPTTIPVRGGQAEAPTFTIN